MDNVIHNSYIYLRGYCNPNGSVKVYVARRFCEDMVEFKIWCDYMKNNYTNILGTNFLEFGNFSENREIRPKLT